MREAEQNESFVLSAWSLPFCILYRVLTPCRYALALSLPPYRWPLVVFLQAVVAFGCFFFSLSLWPSSRGVGKSKWRSVFRFSFCVFFCWLRQGGTFVLFRSTVMPKFVLRLCRFCRLDSDVSVLSSDAHLREPLGPRG